LKKELNDFTRLFQMSDQFALRKPFERSHIALGKAVGTTAQMCAEFISPLSFVHFVKRALMVDKDAMLKLGDFYFFGLKKFKVDKEKAVKYYQQPDYMGSVEASIQCALICYYLFTYATATQNLRYAT
jgi:TPR repeat protein